jgi:bifunctional non-homologous end joining protein LigD
VCGWLPGRGPHRSTFGALLLGIHDAVDGRLRYVGAVGTGFSDRDRQTLRALLDDRGRAHHPFDEPPPTTEIAEVAAARWVVPDLVGDVAYREWTRPEHRLRHPSWHGLRGDVTPEEVTAVFDEPPRQ